MAQLVNPCLGLLLLFRCSSAARLTLELDEETNVIDTNVSAVPPSRVPTVEHLSNVLQLAKVNYKEPCVQQTEEEHCFGYVGPGCDKTPGDNCGEGRQAVSVGSLAHDACCYECTGGLACSGTAPSLISRESLDDSYPCSPEWRKAVWNQLDKRFWCKDQYAQPSNVTVISSKEETEQRQYGIAKYEGKSLGNRVLQPYTAIEALCAPAGTKLDCIDCAPCVSDCEAGIGDSDFCCSGRFIAVRTSLMRRCLKCLVDQDIQVAYGVCA